MTTPDKAEPECEQSVVNGAPMHNAFRSGGNCLFCLAIRSAYKRGVDAALNGWEGF